MHNASLPDWLTELDEDDLQFLKRFLLADGSLKDLATVYGVSYPTVRSRLDRLIAKVKAVDSESPADPFERRIRVLVADGSLPPKTARELLESHRQSLTRKK